MSLVPRLRSHSLQALFPQKWVLFWTLPVASGTEPWKEWRQHVKPVAVLCSLWSTWAWMKKVLSDEARKISSEFTAFSCFSKAYRICKSFPSKHKTYNILQIFQCYQPWISSNDIGAISNSYPSSFKFLFSWAHSQNMPSYNRLWREVKICSIYLSY